MIVNGYKIEPGADLFGVQLTNKNLSSADLSDAILAKACLSFANLSFANLRGANCDAANFDGANLEGANLTGAILTGATITRGQIKRADGSRVVKIGKTHKEVIPALLSEIDFKIDVEVKETPDNRDRIITRLEQLSADVARLAGISKAETPAKTVLAAIEASNLTPEIMELVSDAVLDCADME